MKKFITIVFTFTLLYSCHCKQYSNSAAQKENKTINAVKGKILLNNDSYFIYEKWSSINESKEIYQKSGLTLQLKNFLDESKNIGGKKIFVNDNEIDFIVTDASVFTPFIFFDGDEKILLIQEEDESGIYGYWLYYFNKEKFVKKAYLEIAPENTVEINKFIKFKNQPKDIIAIILTNKYYDTKLNKIKSSTDHLTISKIPVQKKETTFGNRTQKENNKISFLGIWKTKCNTNDHVSNILFYNKSEGELNMYNNTKLVSKMMVEISSDQKLLKYVGTNIIGEGVDVKKITTLNKGDVIAKIEAINENKISIHWLGFEKEKLFIKNPFSQESSTTLTKCDE